MIDINFDFNQDTCALNVTIETERLHMQSITPDDRAQYLELFGDAEAMTKFGDGEVWSEYEVAYYVNMWASRWQHNIPFSAFSVSKKNGVFIGNVVMGYGSEPGQSELAYAFKKEFWRQGYGTEAVFAIVNEYAPKVFSLGYAIKGKQFSSIEATARDDNEFSSLILEHAGMQHLSDVEKYGDGHIRYVFVKAVVDANNTSLLQQEPVFQCANNDK